LLKSKAVFRFQAIWVKLCGPGGFKLWVKLWIQLVHSPLTVGMCSFHTGTMLPVAEFSAPDTPLSTPTCTAVQKKEIVTQFEKNKFETSFSSHGRKGKKPRRLSSYGSHWIQLVQNPTAAQHGVREAHDVEQPRDGAGEEREVARQRVGPRGVAVQVAFVKSTGLKPGYHLTGTRHKGTS
jgi:hypothetical protein